MTVGERALAEYLMYRISIPPERRKGMGRCILCGSKKYNHKCISEKVRKKGKR